MTELSRDEQQRRWEAFRARPGNRTCAECAAQDTTWAVLDYGILICIHCAGAHRAPREACRTLTWAAPRPQAALRRAAHRVPTVGSV